MTPELWLEAHSYLRPLADLSAQVDRAAAGIDVLDARMPDWENYRADFLAGVPLLPSTAAAVDLEPGGRMTGALLERLASGTLSGRFAAETRTLDTELRREPQVSRRIADFLLGDETLETAVPRAIALSGVDGDGAVPSPRGERLRRLARRGAVASQVLPDVRIPARDGPAGRHRSRSLATTFLRLLRNALAIPANGMPVLRVRGRSSSLCDRDRGREIPSYRLLPVLPRLSENL